MKTIYITYEVTEVEAPTKQDPRGALQDGFFVESARRLPIYVVTWKTLNVRRGPKTAFLTTHALTAGDEVTVYETSAGWARISESCSDWCSMQCLTERKAT